MMTDFVKNLWTSLIFGHAPRPEAARDRPFPSVPARPRGSTGGAPLGHTGSLSMGKFDSLNGNYWKPFPETFGIGVL